MPQKTINRRELERLLIQRAWREPDFQQQIVSDPKRTVEAFLCRKLPENLRVFVHLEDQQTFHFSVPLRPDDREVLSDDELEQVPGSEHIMARFLSGLAGGMAVSIAGNAW